MAYANIKGDMPTTQRYFWEENPENNSVLPFCIFVSGFGSHKRNDGNAFWIQFPGFANMGFETTKF